MLHLTNSTRSIYFSAAFKIDFANSAIRSDLNKTFIAQFVSNWLRLIRSVIRWKINTAARRWDASADEFIRAENNKNALVIATRAIALILVCTYLRRIDRSRNPRSPSSFPRVRFILTFIHLARLLADTSIRSNRAHTYTLYTHVIPYMCIYDFSMCTSSFPAPLCRSRSSKFPCFSASLTRHY